MMTFDDLSNKAKRSRARSSKHKTLRIQVRRRRFAFRFGLSAAAVKEWPSSKAEQKLASFAVALDSEREPHEVRRLLRAEILKRISG